MFIQLPVQFSGNSLSSPWHISQSKRGDQWWRETSQRDRPPEQQSSQCQNLINNINIKSFYLPWMDYLKRPVNWIQTVLIRKHTIELNHLGYKEAEEKKHCSKVQRGAPPAWWWWPWWWRCNEAPRCRCRRSSPSQSPDQVQRNPAHICSFLQEPSKNIYWKRVYRAMLWYSTSIFSWAPSSLVILSSHSRAEAGPPTWKSVLHSRS